MVAGSIIGFSTSVVPILKIDDFGLRLLVTTGLSALIWGTTLLLTQPESDDTLDRFYAKVRPGGPGWSRQRQRTGIAPAQSLKLDLQRVVAGIFVLFGGMFALGGFLLLKGLTGFVSLAIAVIAFQWLRRLTQQTR